MEIKKSTGYWTVWDTGFAYVVAPTNPQGHPHINAAIQISAKKRFQTGSLMSDESIKIQLKKAWDYANKLNSKETK